MKPPLPPATTQQRSGQLRLRMPASLHEDLVRAAEADRVSLNQFICCALAGGVRWKVEGRDPAARADRDPDAHVWDFWRERFR